MKIFPFATGVNDTGGSPLAAKMSANFKKFCKKLKSKISWHWTFNTHGCINIHQRFNYKPRVWLTVPIPILPLSRVWYLDVKRNFRNPSWNYWTIYSEWGILFVFNFSGSLKMRKPNMLFQICKNYIDFFLHYSLCNC